jgi:hypothetical protein
MASHKLAVLIEGPEWGDAKFLWRMVVRPLRKLSLSGKKL